MTGPEHYLEGERQQQEAYDNASTPQEELFHLMSAQNHFIAGLEQSITVTASGGLTPDALTASHASSAHPDSTSWDHAINPPETQ